jgi:hypothetical protein
MTPAEKLELETAMDAIRAEEKLRAGCHDTEVYDLVLRATGSAERAEKATAKRMAERLRNNQTFGEQ